MTYILSDEMSLNTHVDPHYPMHSTTTLLSNVVMQQATRLLQNTVSTTATEDEDDEPQWKRTLAIVLSNVFLFFLIFGLSATCDSRHLRKQLTNKFAIGTGITMQYLFMPILGCLGVSIFTHFGLTQAMGIALLVVTASPGGSYSNWWCSTFNADLPLSVAMTTISSLLSVVLLPLNLFLYSWLAFGVFSKNTGTDASSIVKSLDFKSLFQSLAVVLGAILSGLIAGYKFDTPKFHNRANKLGSICGICLITISIVVVSGPKSDLGSLPWSFYVATLIPCIGGLFLAHFFSKLAKLSPPEVMSIAIECCCQNTGIATSVAITMFDNPTERAQAVAVPLFYGIASAVSILCFCIFSWKMGWTKAPANEKIWTVITTTYEVDFDAENNGGADSDDEPDVIDCNTPVKDGNERSRVNTGDSLTTATIVSSEMTVSTPQTVAANISISDEDDDIDYDVEDPRSRTTSNSNERFLDEFEGDSTFLQRPTTPGK